MEDEATDDVIAIREPDPADKSINRAMAEGVLDASALSRARTAAEVARPWREPAGDSASPLTDRLAELRADER